MKNSFCRFKKVCFLISVFLFSGALFSQATYTKNGSSNWTSAAGWTIGGTADGDGDGIPDANDNVIINTAVTVSVTANAACNTMSITTGTVNITSNNVTLAIGTTLTTSSCTFRTSLASTTRSVTVGTTMTVGAGTTNIGSINLTVTGLTTVNGTIDYITTTSGVKTYAGGLTINGTSSNTILESISVTTDLTNNGTYTAGNGATIAVGGNLANNGGTFTQGSATINVTGNLTNSATYNANSGAIDINGNLVINAGTFNAGSGTIDLAGNMVNDGTFNGGTGTITFSGATSNTVSGTAATTTFNDIVMNKGASNANVMDFQCVITMATQGLTLSNGTFKLSSASTITPFGADIDASPYLIPATAGLWCNGGTINSDASLTSSTVGDALCGNWTVAGLVRVSAGTVSMGTAADQRFRAEGGTTVTIIDGGTFNVSGRFSRSGASGNTITFSSGFFNVSTAGNTSTTFAPINLDQANETFNWSGGTLTIVRPGGSNLGYYAVANPTYNITGGTLQIGSAATPAGQTIEVNSTASVFNLVVGNTVATTARLETNNLSVLNDLTISAGTLNANSLNLAVGRHWTNNGTFTPGTQVVTLNGTVSQNIAGTSATTFDDLTINNSLATTPNIVAGVNFTVGGDLILTKGVVDLGGFTCTIGTGFGTIAACGTVTRTAGFMYNGTLIRNMNSTSFAMPTSSRGLFPLGTKTDGDFYRPFWLAYSSNLTSGGTVSVTHSGVIGTTAATHNDASWGFNDVAVTNSTWTVAVGGGFAFNGATGQVRFGGDGFGSNVLAHVNASFLASVVGTHGAATNTTVDPEGNRTGLTTANLTAGAWRLGTKNTSLAPLPIELLSFNGHENNIHVELEWQTASELNNDFFTLEKSVDGVDFTAFSVVDSKAPNGNSAGNLNYMALDLNPFFGTNYYRLKQTDFGGAFKYSNVIAVEFGSTGAESVIVFPNPCAGDFTLDFSDVDIDNDVSVEVVDMQGRIVFFNSFPVSDVGAHKIFIQPMEKIGAGLYNCTLKTGNRIIHKKVLVQ